jgi:hypothetical protein
VKCETLSPVDYVNPYIGTTSQILVPCYPTVNLPNGMLRWYPSSAASGRRESISYNPDNLRFPLILTTHRGDLNFGISASSNGGMFKNHEVDLEEIKPYYYYGYLIDEKIDCSFSFFLFFFDFIFCS